MGTTELHGSPAKDVRSCVEDLARFAVELLAPTLIERATLAEATRDQLGPLAGVVPDVGRFDDNTWGLGFERKGTKAPHWMPPQAEPATFGHFGGSGTFLWVEPDASVACVCLADREFGPWALDAWPSLGSRVLQQARR
jgi:CubicO group peptidase (beta-lactamase class C family)